MTLERFHELFLSSCVIPNRREIALFHPDILTLKAARKSNKSSSSKEKQPTVVNTRLP